MKKCLIFMFCAMFAICFTGGLCGTEKANRAPEGLELGNRGDGQAILSKIPPKPTDAPNPDETPGSPNNPNPVPNGPAIKEVKQFTKDIEDGDEFIWRNELVTNKLQKGSVFKIILEKVGSDEWLVVYVTVASKEEVSLRTNCKQIGKRKDGQLIFLAIYTYSLSTIFIESGYSVNEVFKNDGKNRGIICWDALKSFTKDRHLKIYTTESRKVFNTVVVRDWWLR